MQTLNKQTFKTMIHMSLLLPTLALALAIWSTGCGPTTLQKTQMKIQTLSLEGAKEARARSVEARDALFNCVKDYARKNARTSASPSEVSEAAVSQCQDFVSRYRMSQSDYHRYMASADALSIKDLDRARSKGEEESRLDAQELVDEGKRLAIRIVLEIRQ